MASFFLELKKNAERFPATVALASTTGHLSYEFLQQNIEAIAANAVAARLEPGQTVLVDCSNNEARLLLALGLMRAGLIVAVGQEPGLFESLEVGLDAVITDDTKLKTEFRTIRLAPHWFKMPSKAKPPPGSGKDYGLICSSSGSTGERKLIKFSRANLEYRIWSKLDEPYFAGNTRFYSTAGSTSSGSFADFMITLQKGGLIIQGQGRLVDNILNTISLFRPSYVSMAPVMLVRILRRLQEDPRRLDKVPYLRLTGAYCALRTPRGSPSEPGGRDHNLLWSNGNSPGRVRNFRRDSTDRRVRRKGSRRDCRRNRRR